MPSQASPDPFFLPLDKGDRFCLHHAPANPLAPARASVVFVHGFAEEMNKSRRMVALQARALAAAQCAVLQIDLLGCGDSAGLLSDATWDDWVTDVVEACLWLQQQHPVPVWLWGLRAGCLVAVDAARKLSQPCNFLL